MTNCIPMQSPIGKYVHYKNVAYILVEMRGHLAIILRQYNCKLQVRFSLLTPIPNAPKVVCVEHKGTQYLVTPLSIISLKTKRFMQWPEDNGDRVAILRAANSVD